MSTLQSASTSERPEFAVALGLLPPYALEDVKRAYLAKVKSAHPDHGGARADFDKIQHAYEQAMAYLSFRGDRRRWIAARMDQYVAVVELAERVRQLGATVDTSIIDWMKESFGDFADLSESIVSIERRDSGDLSELLDTIVRESSHLAGLKRLSLAGSTVTDAQVLQLRPLAGLAHLDLSRTPITSRALAVVDWLPQLETFNIDGTSIGWWAQQRLRRKMKRRQMPTLAAVVHAMNTS